MKVITPRFGRLVGILGLLVAASTAYPEQATLPTYAPETMASSGPVHRGLAVASERMLKGRVIAISPDNLSAITVSFPPENTVYIEAVFAGGKWNGEEIHTNYRVRGATFDRTQQKVMLAVAHIPNLPQSPVGYVSEGDLEKSSLYLYDLQTKKGTFLPLATKNFAWRTFLSWSVDNLIDVASENGWFVVNLDTLAISTATPAERARREELMPKTPPLIFKDGFISQPGSLTKRIFRGGQYFIAGTLWPNAAAVADRDKPVIYYLKSEQPYWPWGGNAELSPGSTEMTNETTKLDQYLERSGYAGEGNWARPPVEGQIFRPKINPLNGRAVGANMDMKVANVRLTKRDDKGIGFVIDETFLAPKDGDVVANIRNTDSWAPNWKSAEGFYLEIRRLER